MVLPPVCAEYRSATNFVNICDNVSEGERPRFGVVRPNYIWKPFLGRFTE